MEKFSIQEMYQEIKNTWQWKSVTSSECICRSIIIDKFRKTNSSTFYPCKFCPLCSPKALVPCSFLEDGITRNSSGDFILRIRGNKENLLKEIVKRFPNLLLEEEKNTTL